MTNYIKEMRDEINSVSVHMTDQELFSSRAFMDYLKNILRTALGKYPDRNVDLCLDSNSRNGTDGYTVGSRIYINSSGPLASAVSTRIDRFYIILGILVHEIGHRLFTDFKALKSFMETWDSAIRDKAEPPYPVDDPRFEQMVSELREYPNLAYCWLRIIKSLQNIFEDGYIEQRLILTFSGMNAMALQKLNRELFRMHPSIAESFEEIVRQEDQDHKDMLVVSFLMNQMLRYVKEFPEKKGSWEADPEKDNMYMQYDRFMETVMPLLDDLMYQRDSALRYARINEVMLDLYDYFPGKLEQDSEDQEESDENGESGSSGTGSSSAERKDIPSEMREMEIPVFGETAVPEGDSAPVPEEKEDEEKAERKERIKELSESEKSGSREFESAMKDVIRHIAEANIESMHQKELEQEGAEIERAILAGVSNPPEEWSYTIHRERTDSINEWDRFEYEMIASNLRSIAEPAKRRLNAVLKKREETGSSKGYQTGRFDPLQYSRAALSGDGRMFRQTRDPIGKPSIAFAVLIDESGSMESGYPVNKYETARRSAILLNDILSDVNVPHMIAGHTDNEGTCDILMYHDFDEVDHRDRYRLTGISARSGNRDGAAIAYCCEKLLKRSEADKILIVISDGMPTECGFFSTDAKKDTVITIARYRKKGCRIIGAIIDSYGSVESIYGRNNCLDLTELTKVPVALAELVKRYILK